MFNNKLKRAVKRLEQTLDTKYWELKESHQRLLSALGLVEQVTQHRIDYVKKGGPEKGDE